MASAVHQVPGLGITPSICYPVIDLVNHCNSHSISVIFTNFINNQAPEKPAEQPQTTTKIVLAVLNPKRSE
jgi:hypothetical protein